MVVLVHPEGAKFVVEMTSGSGSASEHARKWQDLASKSGTNVEKLAIKPVSVHPDLDAVQTGFKMTVADGGGSQRLGVMGTIAVNEEKQTLTAAAFIAPTSLSSDSPLLDDGVTMMKSVLQSQVN